jgi:C1A family cysteine protease
LGLALCADFLPHGLNYDMALKAYVENMDKQIHSEFLRFKVDYERQYGNSYEELNRLMRFEYNFKKWEEHNANPEHMYTVGVTQFADWHPEEYQRMLTPDEIVRQGFEEASRDSVEMPRNTTLQASKCNYLHDTMPRIKDQKQCGSCWAFAGVATVEAAHAMRNNKRIDSLSEM